MPTFSPQLTVPVGALGVLLALYCVWRLVQALRKSFVSRLPLVERQTVNLEEAGSFAINLESPQLSFADFGLGPLTMKGSMTDRSTGREVPVKRNLFGMTVKGFSRMRRPLFRFQIERPGSYELAVHGIPDRRGLDKCNLVFTRPLGAKVIPLTLGIMAGMTALISSIVLSAVTADPLRASVVDSCLDGSDAACEGLAAMADQRCSGGDTDACETLGLLKSQGRGTTEDLYRMPRSCSNAVVTRDWQRGASTWVGHYRTAWASSRMPTRRQAISNKPATPVSGWAVTTWQCSIMKTAESGKPSQHGNAVVISRIQVRATTSLRF